MYDAQYQVTLRPSTSRNTETARYKNNATCEFTQQVMGDITMHSQSHSMITVPCKTMCNNLYTNRSVSKLGILVLILYIIYVYIYIGDVQPDSSCVSNHSFYIAQTNT